MRRTLYTFYSKDIGWILAALFLAGCVAGKPLPEQPEYLVSGTKMINRGVGWYKKGCYERALEEFFRAHELFSQSDRIEGVALCMNNIGNVYRIKGDMANAQIYFKESYALYKEIDDGRGMLQALSNKAAALIEADQIDAAKRILQSADQLTTEKSIDFAPILHNWGLVQMKQKNFLEAETKLKQALKLSSPDNKIQMAAIHFALGKLMHATDRPAQAVAQFQLALAADQSAGFNKGLADDLAALGEAHSNLNQHEAAVGYYKRSIKIYALLGRPDSVSEVLEKLDQSAQKANMDITVTGYFVKQWLEGKYLLGPCE